MIIENHLTFVYNHLNKKERENGFFIIFIEGFASFISPCVLPMLPIYVFAGTLGKLIFEMLFSVCWTPCVGVFLSSALMMSATSENILKGGLMLLIYSIDKEKINH